MLAPAVAQTVGPLVQITADDPFATCTADNVAQQEKSIGSILFSNTAIEPWVAVDTSTDPPGLLVGHQQDRWNDGGSRGLVGNRSTDGGSTWKETIPGGVSECTGGSLVRASDPWVTFSPKGHAFFSSLVSNPSRTPAFGVSGGGQLVSRSTDHGATWEAPITLITDGANVLNDKNSITADPLDENFVFTVWDRLVLGASNGAVGSDGVAIAQSRLPGTPANAIGPHPSRGPTLLSRTTNGGDSWETPRVIFDPGVDSQTINNQTVVLPNGDVLVFFSELLSSGVNNIAFVRSTDKGFTFDATPTIATNIEVVRTFTPDEHSLVRDASLLFSVNVDPNVKPDGAIYLVWQDCRFGTHDCGSATPVDDVAFIQSLDAGKTWSAPAMINKTPQDLGNPLRQQAFIPAITSAGDGTLAVTYYDFRNDVSTAGEELVDYFAVFCTAATADCTDARNWKNERRLTTGPISHFNILDAPNAAGHFLGDYMGLVASGSNVTPVFGAVTGHNLTADFTRMITLPH
ncbi:MAG TPA: sialidase family protein [Stellaceae bacterium]|nr:sialidase family protein [Stellaceae bacterium]